LYTLLFLSKGFQGESCLTRRIGGEFFPLTLFVTNLPAGRQVGDKKEGKKFFSMRQHTLNKNEKT